MLALRRANAYRLHQPEAGMRFAQQKSRTGTSKNAFLLCNNRLREGSRPVAPGNCTATAQVASRSAVIHVIDPLTIEVEQGETMQLMSFKRTALLPVAALLALTCLPAAAKDTVKIAFIGPLSGGVSANGVGGRNSADDIVNFIWLY